MLLDFAQKLIFLFKMNRTQCAAMQSGDLQCFWLGPHRPRLVLTKAAQTLRFFAHNTNHRLLVIIKFGFSYFHQQTSRYKRFPKNLRYLPFDLNSPSDHSLAHCVYVLQNRLKSTQVFAIFVKFTHVFVVHS